MPFCLNFLDCESFLESNSPDILALCETDLDDSIDSGNFFMRGCLPLIRKDFSTHMHGLAVYVNEGLSFAQDLSLENSADSDLRFRLALLHSVSYFFFLYRSPSSSLCTVFDSISSNIDDVLFHHKDWPTYFGGTDWPGELCYNFSISNDLTQMVNFPTWILDVTLKVLHFWISFFLLMLSLVLQWLSLHWEILFMLLSQFPLTFCQNQNRMSHFIA